MVPLKVKLSVLFGIGAVGSSLWLMNQSDNIITDQLLVSTSLIGCLLVIKTISNLKLHG